ncbi:hypothetical protein [Sulfuricurvum sp.]|uniref:hypothetical protein n=1 Tax=Sulfuricurvum sp. TaxID=2025608 RepID=UPI002E32F3C2|nr:hypothetical protein [Sulfuricurvum sp.]HEX5330961.1 hypothetical protein [Sulfuricurvum sp.]
MISIDLLLVILGMSLLFLRHISVYKDPTKINYTPVVLGLGFVGALLHFVLSPLIDINIIKESLLSLSVGILLSAVMSVMNQSISVMNTHAIRLRIHEIGDELSTLASSLMTLKDRIDLVTQMESSTHEQIRNVFKDEFEVLNTIDANQNLFITKIEALLLQQQTAMKKFEEFTLSELPSLDNVVHRHIDMLRIAEQDHFNQLKNVAQFSCDEQKELHSQLQELRTLLTQMAHQKNPEHTVAIVQKELDRVVHDFAHHLQMLGSKSETIVTSLLENDALLRGSREQSELIMQQMVLSSKQMREMTSHSKELSDSLAPLTRLFASAESLYNEFVHAKGKLRELIVTLESYEHQEYRAIRQSLEEVASEAIAQMKLLVHTLQTKESQNKEVLSLIETKNVQELASKVKLHKSYLGETQE